MALLQIAEPGKSTAPHQHKLAVGIDLGTTNSVLAYTALGADEPAIEFHNMNRAFDGLREDAFDPARLEAWRDGRTGTAGRCAHSAAGLGSGPRNPFHARGDQAVTGPAGKPAGTPGLG